MISRPPDSHDAYLATIGNLACCAPSRFVVMANVLPRHADEVYDLKGTTEDARPPSQLIKRYYGVSADLPLRRHVPRTWRAKLSPCIRVISSVNASHTYHGREALLVSQASPWGACHMDARAKPSPLGPRNMAIHDAPLSPLTPE